MYGGVKLLPRNAINDLVFFETLVTMAVIKPIVNID